MRILLDTGPLVALLNKRDSHHGWSVEKAADLHPPFLSCEAVLTEAHHLLKGTRHGRRRLIDLVDSGNIELTGIVAENLDRVGELMSQYANVPMDFADACLVCMAEKTKGIVFTIDGDFRVYRKNRDEAIDLIIP